MGKPGAATGLFKGARDFSSPCSAGIPGDKKRSERRSAGVTISVEAANRHLVSVVDIEVLIHHDFHGPETAPRVVRWADLELSDGEEPSIAETAASSVTGHADGRPDNALWVLGRRGGLVSTTPSRGASSAERRGDLRDSGQVSRTASSALPTGDSSQPGGGARPPAKRLLSVRQRLLSSEMGVYEKLRPEPLCVSLLELLPLESQSAAERV